jgi:hypothetical protein
MGTWSFSFFDRFSLSPAEAGYSGSAATLEEEAHQALFSSPPRDRNAFTWGLYVRLTDRRTA